MSDRQCDEEWIRRGGKPAAACGARASTGRLLNRSRISKWLRCRRSVARLAIVGTRSWAGQMAAPAPKGTNPTVGKVSLGSQILGSIRLAQASSGARVKEGRENNDARAARHGPVAGLDIRSALISNRDNDRLFRPEPPILDRRCNLEAAEQKPAHRVVSSA